MSDFNSNMEKMMEKLLDKYERGLCSAEETRQVEDYLARMEQEYVPGYGELSKSVDEVSVDIDVTSLIERRNREMEDMLIRYENGKCDIEEMKVVDGFLADQERMKMPLYEQFVIAEKLVSLGTQSDVLIEHAKTESLIAAYENGTSSQEETVKVESLLESIAVNDIPGYADFVLQQKEVSCDIKVLDLIQEEAKVIPMKSSGSWRQWGMIAASLIFVIAAVFILKPDSNDGTIASIDTNTVEIEDADEALEFTLAALGLTSKKMKKGTDNMKHLEDLRHTQIYK